MTTEYPNLDLLKAFSTVSSEILNYDHRHIEIMIQISEKLQYQNPKFDTYGQPELYIQIWITNLPNFRTSSKSCDPKYKSKSIIHYYSPKPSLVRDPYFEQ